MATAAVRVALRVRPLTQKEQMCNCTECISFFPGQPQILIGNDHPFTFDYVFDTQSHQSDIYNVAVLPLVDKFAEGFNATILAYGQTGSGKTYSMGTAIDGNINSEQQGIIPRFIYDIFSRLDKKKSTLENYNYEIYVSFLELYNEDLVDLLNVQQFNRQRKRTTSGGSICEISIREDVQGNIYWSNVREERCTCPDDLFGYLAKGSLCRTTAKTDMNAVSSRSHAIFSVILKQQVPDDTTEEQQQQQQTTAAIKTLVSKFHFVDLAGSERLKRTNAHGDRAREGIAINSGLLALGNVISALGDESRRSTHVPYRDSKLTRLLQDSLGGNSQTLMVACVSASDTNFTETLSTLKYANRARNIKNRVTINQEFAGSSVEINQLRALVNKLKMELNTLRLRHGSGADTTASSLLATTETEGLRQEVNTLRARVQQVSDELYQVSAERDTLLLEREMNNMPSQDWAALMQQFTDTPATPPSPSSSPGHDLPRTLPLVANYQKTIQDLRNELADTRERLAFVESTQAPMMQALRMTADITPVASFSTNTRKTTTHRRNRRKHIARNGSSTTGYRSVRASKVPHVNSAKRSSGRRRLLSDDSMPSPPLPPPLPVSDTDHNDIEQWLQETIGSFNGDTSTADIRSEVRHSIEKARAEIERGLKVLEEVRSNSAAHEAPASYDIMADDELIEALQSKENEYIFTELEHEMLDDLENTPPPQDWSDTSDSGLGHSRTTSGDTTLSHDENEIALFCKENPQLGRMIQQVQADIRVKEELVSQLEKSETEFTQMRKKFEQKLYTLSQEILTIRRERDMAVRRSSYSQVSKGDTLSQREKQQMSSIRQAYEIKMKSLLAQLSELRRKYTQTTSAIQSSRNQNESMLRSLRVDVESLKVEKKRMIKRMKEEAERVKEQMLAQEREIQQLRRKQTRDAEVKRRLERENKNTQLMLQKRTDEVVLTNERLKQLISILKKAVREGGVLDERLLIKCAGILNLGGVAISRFTAKRRNKSTVPVEIRAAKKKSLLDRALYQYINGKQALREMQQLIAKRDDLARKRQELVSERQHVYVGHEPIDDAMQQFIDERLETVNAEIAYTNARIQALQNDAAHEIMQDEGEEVVDMDAVSQQQQNRPAKHVTFADEVMGYKRNTDPADEWLDMDSLEERYTLPSNADPDTCHDMMMRLIASLASDETEKIMDLFIQDITALRMDEYVRQAHTQQLEKTVQDLQRTLIVMKNKAIETAIGSEKKIKRLQQGSRRSSMSTLEDLQDDDSAIDLRIEEHYSVFDKIYNDGLNGAIHSPVYNSRPASPASMEVMEVVAKSCHSGSPTLRPQPPQPPQSLVDKPGAPLRPCASPLVPRRDSLSSPEQFLMQASGFFLPKAPPSPRLCAAELARYHADRESSTSTIQSQHLRRSSVQSDMSWSSHGSKPSKPPLPQTEKQPLANRRRAHSLQQQQQQQPLSPKAIPNSRRRFSLRDIKIGNYYNDAYVAHQPSPLQQQFVIPRTPDSPVAGYEESGPYSRPSSAAFQPHAPQSTVSSRAHTPMSGNVFDRLANFHTHSSQAKRLA